MAGIYRIWIPGFLVNNKKPLYEATWDLIVNTWSKANNNSLSKILQELKNSHKVQVS
jgi:hypothetical protein